MVISCESTLLPRQAKNDHDEEINYYSTYNEIHGSTALLKIYVLVDGCLLT